LVFLLPRPSFTLAVLASVGFFAGIDRFALAQTPAGLLECNISGGVGAVVTSTKSLACTFRPVNGTAENYDGTLSTLGVDVGFTDAGRLTWAVAMADLSPKPFPLAGSYAGATAGIAVGPGAKANTLVGGNGNGISLQPLSVATQTGLDLSAGIGSLTLTPALQAPPPPGKQH
jgi:hypothetical protein